MKTKSILFSVFICVGFLASAISHAQGLSDLQSIEQTDFGLFPTKKVQKKPGLPDCEDLKYSEEALMGLKSHQDLCIGTISPYTEGSENPEFWIESETEYESALVRVLKRNPGLMSLNKFLKICKPLGGWLSPDGLYCGYTIVF